eukprot:gene3812-4069_t
MKQTEAAVEAGWGNLGSSCGGGGNAAHEMAGGCPPNLAIGGASNRIAASNPGVAAPYHVGRWCGPYAVINSASAGSSGPENCMAGTVDLQCDEELQSMDTVDFIEPQQRLQDSSMSHGSSYKACLQLSPSAALSDAVGWCEHSDEVACMFESHHNFDAAAAAASRAKDSKQLMQQVPNFPGTKAAQYLSGDHQHTPAIHHSESILQMLNNAACLRKKQQVLTASAAHARACGAESVRTRLLITELSLYMPHATSSRLALDQANQLMSSMVLPDGVTYMPVHPDSFLYKTAANWHFPAFVICLGSSYLQRILEKLPQLASTALTCPGFEDYCAYLQTKPSALSPKLTGREAAACLATLRSVLFTCLFLATKIADQIHAMGLLRFMLCQLSHGRGNVTLQQAAILEAQCLVTLDWRLGPYFMDDSLHGNDETAWAAAMGSSSYGTGVDLFDC